MKMIYKVIIGVALLLMIIGGLMVFYSMNKGEKSVSYDFSAQSCNAYAQIMNCVIDHLPEKQRIIVRPAFEKTIASWEEVSSEELSATCDNALELLDYTPEFFQEPACAHLLIK